MPPVSELREIFEVLLRNVVPSFVVAGVVLLLVGRLLPARWSPAAGALALAAGFLAGLYFSGDVRDRLVKEGPGTPAEMLQKLKTMRWQFTEAGATEAQQSVPAEPLSWFPWTVGLVLVIGSLGHLPRVLLTWGFRVLAVALSVLFLETPDLRSKVPWLLPAFAAVVLVQWWALDDLARERPGGWLPLGLLLCFLTTAFITLATHYALLTEVVLLLAGATGGIALAAWRYKSDTSGFVAGPALALPALLLIAQQSTENSVPIASFVLAGAAPLVLVVLVPFKGRLSGQKLALVGLLLFLVPLAVAVALLVQSGALTSG
jgi:hypothetical protein